MNSPAVPTQDVGARVDDVDVYHGPQTPSRIPSGITQRRRSRTACSGPHAGLGRADAGA